MSSAAISIGFILLRLMELESPLQGWIQRSASGTGIQGQEIKPQGDTPFSYLFLIYRQCLALLQGHTASVCQLQLSPTILATGGSDGRVITFCLKTYNVLHHIAAHDSSVTSLQFDDNLLVTGGKDGRVRLFETQTGNPVRELNDSSERVWKVAYTKETCAIMCKRAGHTVMEVWSM